MPESRRPRRAGSQGGSIVVTTVLLCAVLAVLVTMSLTLAKSATSGSGHEARGAVALQAADAGVNRYMARLASDSGYTMKFVDPAEDARVPTAGGAAVPPGQPWPGGTWTYAGAPADAHHPADRLALRRGPTTHCASTPRPAATRSRCSRSGAWAPTRPSPLSRAVQVRIQPGSFASFQILSDESLTISASTRTDGKVYSSGDINHRGTADGPLYAQRDACDQGADVAILLGIITSDNSQPCGGVTETSQFEHGAYDARSLPSITDELPGPIDFDAFEQARLAVRTAAMDGGLYINGSSASTGGLLETLLGALGLTGYMAQLEENPSGPGRIRSIRSSTSTSRWSRRCSTCWACRFR